MAACKEGSADLFFYYFLCNRLVGRSWFLVISHILPHFIFMQPDGICVPSDELVHIHAVDGWRSLDSLLLPIDEDGHVFFLLANCVAYFD